jgi:hypothetical protein
MYIETHIDLQQYANSTAAAAAAADAQQQCQDANSTVRPNSSRSPAAEGRCDRNSSKSTTHQAPVRTRSDSRLLAEPCAGVAGSNKQSARHNTRQMCVEQEHAFVTTAGHVRSSHHSRAPSSPAALHFSTSSAAAPAATGVSNSSSSLQDILLRSQAAGGTATAGAVGLCKGPAGQQGDAEEEADNAMHAAVASTLMHEQAASNNKVG